jgi:hypothetical protein
MGLGASYCLFLAVLYCNGPGWWFCRALASCEVLAGHVAIHGHTAAEDIHERADAKQPLMGLKTTRPGGKKPAPRPLYLPTTSFRSFTSSWYRFYMRPLHWVTN